MTITDHMEEKFAEPTPPSAERVARRALVLAAVSCRGIVEGDTENRPRADGLARQARSWLHTVGLEKELSEWENRVVDAPIGGLSDRERINASWLSEAVAVLAWALGKKALPGYEEQCDPAAVAYPLGFLQPLNGTILGRAELRPMVELREYNQFIYNLHWRVRDHSLKKRNYDFESMVKKVPGALIDKYGLQLQECDLCVGGVPISRADNGAYRRLASITQERHRVSNWLIGYGSENFYEVSTDT
jgi:Domain of unknown function (DUF4272)